MSYIYYIYLVFTLEENIITVKPKNGINWGVTRRYWTETLRSCAIRNFDFFFQMLLENII